MHILIEVISKHMYNGQRYDYLTSLAVATAVTKKDDFLLLTKIFSLISKNLSSITQKSSFRTRLQSNSSHNHTFWSISASPLPAFKD